jgi:hypothetical protein
MDLKPAHRGPLLHDLRQMGTAQADAGDGRQGGTEGFRRHVSTLSVNWLEDLQARNQEK